MTGSARGFGWDYLPNQDLIDWVKDNFPKEKICLVTRRKGRYAGQAETISDPYCLDASFSSGRAQIS